MANGSNCSLYSRDLVFHQFHINCFMNYNYLIAESDIAAFDTVMWISLVMTGTVGTSLLLGIIYYERYGGDPQKRSLGNRLVSATSQLSLVAIACNFCFVFMVRFDVGSLCARIFMMKMWMGTSISSVSFMNINTLLRFLQVMIWKRVKEINEDLAMRGIFRSTIAICAGITYCVTFGIETTRSLTVFSKEPLEVPTHLCLERKGNVSLTLGSFLGIGLFANALAVALMRTKRIQNPAIIHDVGQTTVGVQNRRYNRALVSNAACPVIVCMYIVGIVIITQKYSVETIGLSQLKTIVIQPLINGCVTPLLYFVFHKSTREFLVASIQSTIAFYRKTM